MAELIVLVCDKCGGKKNVTQITVLRSGKKLRGELCDKCWTEMSKTYHLISKGRGWAAKEVVAFDDIPKGTP
jgi:protein-arginine kinase activator protein McsA